MISKGDIFFARLDNGIGSEQSGYRPVLVIQNRKGNKYSPTIIVAAITSNTTKKTLPTHIFIPKESSKLPEDSIVLLEQIHTIDKARIGTFVGHLGDEIMSDINHGLNCSLEMPIESAFDQPLYFRNKVHEHIYTEIVAGNPRKCSNEYLAALYLLTADGYLWKEAKSKVSQTKILIKEINIRNIGSSRYSLVKLASDILKKSSCLTVKNIFDTFHVPDKMYRLIVTAIRIGRCGYAVLNFCNKSIN